MSTIGAAPPPDDDDELLQLQNLGAKTAIVTTPAKALALLNMNNQLAHPYKVKGAYLI